ncbi:hypothetical protein K438DRAFT_1818422 [Mycena galopus ATCC 62051]|nr:hypothetical protein K438DRAFT_1818422 [Mycena galopus ATCC 62051]
MPTPTTTPTRANTARCFSTVCAASTKGRAGNHNCTQLFCKECCLSSSVQCRLMVHNSRPYIPPLSFGSLATTQLLAPPAFDGPYGQMISPEYAHKILNNNFTVASTNHLQTEAYRMESQTMIKVKYWVKSDLPAITFSVPVPNYPWFHPKTCPTITTRLSSLNISCDSYEILDTTLNPLESTSTDTDKWVTTGSATKVKADMTLYLRSPGVETCPGLRPATPRKRILSQSDNCSPPDSPKFVFDTKFPFLVH